MDVGFLKENFNRFNARIKAHGDKTFLYYWVNFIFSSIRYGASPDDFFRYEFYKKTAKEKDSFITYRRSQKLIKELNNTTNIEHISDKVLFNQYFSDYIQREWLDVRTSNFNDFEKFIRKHKIVIVKPVSGGSGKGIWKYKYDPKDNLKDVFEKNKGSIVEEVIIQHTQLSELNSSSVNTIRVFTVRNQSDVKVIACSLRTGDGSSVIDNLHSGGMSASIHIESGKVFTTAINQNLKRFEEHPSSKVKFKGFQIPNWELAINTVLEAALKIPDVRYLGWDVAILPDNVELIEANHDPAHDLIQISDQIGKYNLIKSFIGSE